MKVTISAVFVAVLLFEFSIGCAELFGVMGRHFPRWMCYD